MSQTVTKALEILKEDNSFAQYDMRFIKPLDEHLLHSIFTTFKTIITI